MGYMIYYPIVMIYMMGVSYVYLLSEDRQI